MSKQTFDERVRVLLSWIITTYIDGYWKRLICDFSLKIIDARRTGFVYVNDRKVAFMDSGIYANTRRHIPTSTPIVNGDKARKLTDLFRVLVNKPLLFYTSRVYSWTCVTKKFSRVVWSSLLTSGLAKHDGEIEENLRNDIGLRQCGRGTSHKTQKTRGHLKF